MKRTPRDAAGSILVLAALVGLWWLAAHQGWLSRVFLPTPEATAERLGDGLVHGDLARDTLATAGRMLAGWLLASLIGVLLGALIGSSAAARTWLQPTLEFVRPLPASALIPLAIAVFGLSAGMVLCVVAFGAMWPVLLATIHGFAAVHERLREVGAALRLSRTAFALKIGLPNAMPDILAGLRLAMTVSLIVSVVGEMLSSQQGLGRAILLAARSFQASELYAGVALLGAIGFAANSFVAGIERHALKWQRG
jgi:sulfonate transport system permease protein